MVCGNATKNRLGQRMDLTRPTTNHTKKLRRRESMIPTPTDEAHIPHHYRKNYGHHYPKNAPKNLCTPTVSKTCMSVQQPRIQEVPTKEIVGPHHQTKARSTCHPH